MLEWVRPRFADAKYTSRGALRPCLRYAPAPSPVSIEHRRWPPAPRYAVSLTSPHDYYYYYYYYYDYDYDHHHHHHHKCGAQAYGHHHNDYYHNDDDDDRSACSHLRYNQKSRGSGERHSRKGG